ncbi:hypothetical protein HDF12_003373 [Edaphobacter lichenicola]|uniref:Uncharacterized protein n=1 Tax=Tunturiibacter lichenicola TaxID=2051959 RepID=A0A7Y9NP62_9BACT|nr:hypothetical protein [Edaphobacter lichenicola]
MSSLHMHICSLLFVYSAEADKGLPSVWKNDLEIGYFWAVLIERCWADKRLEGNWNTSHERSGEVSAEVSVVVRARLVLRSWSGAA